MAAPSVKWTKADGITEVTKWQMGKVNAGQRSDEIRILIWNNQGGESDVSDMQDTQITTTDTVLDDLDVVKDKWVRVRCESAGEDVFTQIGGDEMHTITAQGCEPGVIKGSANDGQLTDIENFASITLYAQTDLNVPAGVRPFKTRVIYYYT